MWREQDTSWWIQIFLKALISSFQCMVCNTQQQAVGFLYSLPSCITIIVIDISYFRSLTKIFYQFLVIIKSSASLMKSFNRYLHQTIAAIAPYLP